MKNVQCLSNISAFRSGKKKKKKNLKGGKNWKLKLKRISHIHPLEILSI